MGSGVCLGCRFDKIIKLKDSPFSFSICANPKMGYKKTEKEELAISTDRNFTECEYKEKP